ncbi:hypothetical protein [Qipengyuania atrilutea]|uniref:Tetratricopeptide repeat protein n=1 Tax=Qipengyuania atrilutea TaxID=2744473 RepID=A0A850H3A7_9SPHN|nr:hypothetical protein [Actirhodobacter atriluteus]NVD43545.1 hypothetical protein [Actirhodobacter atriluteus]
MKRGALLLVFAAIYVWAVVGSGLDRIAEKNAAVVDLVPSPFRAAAERSRAISAIGNEDAEAALEAAEAALRANPADHRSAALLGVANRLAGRETAEKEAFSAARQFGWRDPDTQGFWLEQRLSEGNYDEAVLHLDALLRQFPALPNAQELIANFERNRAGQQALRDRLALDPPWSRTFWQPETEDRETVLRRRARYLGDNSTKSWGCGPSGPLMSGLWETGLRRDAERVMLAQCSRNIAEGSVADPHFDIAQRLGWRRHPSGDITYREKEDGLVVRNRSAATRLVLSQPVAFGEGFYRVALSGENSVAVSLTCGMPQVPPPRSISHTVRVPDCRDQVLGLWVGGGNVATFIAITAASATP